MLKFIFLKLFNKFMLASSSAIRKTFQVDGIKNNSRVCQFFTNTPGTRGGPDGRDRTLAVKDFM